MDDEVTAVGAEELLPGQSAVGEVRALVLGTAAGDGPDRIPGTHVVELGDDETVADLLECGSLVL